MIRYTFSKKQDQDFANSLKSQVAEYFDDQGVSRNANTGMVTKTVLALSLYLGLYLILVLAGIHNTAVLFTLWATMGFVMAFIGTSIMHDALHGSYSGNRWLNKLLGFSAVIVGADPGIWKIQHNVLHHSYTNIEHADEDIAPRYVLRFSPHQPRRWFHRYQHLYILFFYGISTLVWVTAKDFIKLFQYRKKNILPKGEALWNPLLVMIFRKVLYHAIFLVIPMIALPVSPWLTLAMFATMHLVAGLTLSLIFQSAHVVPTSEFIDQEEPRIDEHWLVHQLRTTSNFAMRNRILTWFTGCLNYQIEHHLFPNICHVHYPKISKIVKQLADRYQLPYHEHKTFREAIAKHFHMLYLLGRQDNLRPELVKKST